MNLCLLLLSKEQDIFLDLGRNLAYILYAESLKILGINLKIPIPLQIISLNIKIIASE